MEKHETAEILSHGYAAFPNLTLTPQAVEIWHEMFGTTDPQQFRAALMMAVRSAQSFFPTPGAVQSTLKAIHAQEALRAAAERAMRPALDEPSTPESQKAVEEARRKIREMTKGIAAKKAVGK